MTDMSNQMFGSGPYWDGQEVERRHYPVAIIISDGEQQQAFYDHFTGPTAIEPIRRAGYVARLRALANELEKESEQ